MKIIMILIGGALGALTRYGVSTTISRLSGSLLPVGTLVVNLVGCFLIGLVFGLGEVRGISPNFRLFFITGFLGALTTFSTFSLETVNAAGNGMNSLALLNIAITNTGCILLVVLGLYVAKSV
ncbi:MAG: fluoride efflux transporter CrcB [Armatimonadota bacterium]